MMENKINRGTFAGLSHYSSISSLKLLPLAQVLPFFPGSEWGGLLDYSFWTLLGQWYISIPPSAHLRLALPS